MSFKAETTKALKLSVYSFVDTQKEFSGFLSAYEQNKDINSVGAQSGYSQTSSEIKNFVTSNNYKEATIIEEEEQYTFSINDIHHLLSQINTISPSDLELCLDNISIRYPSYKSHLYTILNSISKEYKIELGKPLLSNLPNTNINHSGKNQNIISIIIIIIILDEHLNWNSKFQSLIELCKYYLNI